MQTRLCDIRACFEGVIPSIVATLDADGLPNVSYLSHVHYVDEAHVALSNQFFSKTAANVRATGMASVLVVDGRSGRQFLLDLTHVDSVEAGPLFERMAVQLAAVSHPGVAEAMALRSAEVYRVEDCRPSGQLGLDPPAAPATPRLSAAALIASRIAESADAEAAVETALDGLAASLQVENAMVLAMEDTSQRLVALASRGYAEGGAGAEVALGDGAIGMAGRSRLPVRLSDMSRGRRMAHAVSASGDLEAEKIIPLPGLPEPQSQLAVPMTARGRLLGVLFAESPQRFRFTHEDEDAFALVAAQLASSLLLAELEARDPRAATPPPAAPAPAATPFQVRYYPHDDSLFIDGDYLIKGVPGRLLFHCLKALVETGRREFTNREIRMDPALRLPDLKDNLETRLILLRRRLDEKSAPVRLSRPARGRLRLEVSGAPVLEVVGR